MLEKLWIRGVWCLLGPCYRGKLYSLALPLRGPHSDFGGPLDGSFAKHSESGGISRPLVFKSLIRDISRHFRGKEEEFTLNERVCTFNAEEGPSFDTFFNRLCTTLLDEVKAADRRTTPGQYPFNRFHMLWSVPDDA